MILMESDSLVYKGHAVVDAMWIDKGRCRVMKQRADAIVN